MRNVVTLMMTFTFAVVVFGQTMNVHTGSSTTSYSLSDIDSITFITSTPANSDSGLFLHYTFDGNTDDSSGYGFHGTATSITYGTDRFGNENSCAVFDGESSSVTVQNSQSAFNLDKLTVCAWVKPERDVGYGMHEMVVAKGAHDLEQAWELLTKRYREIMGGAFSFEFDYRGPAETVRAKVKEAYGTVTDAPSELVVGEWSHLVGSYDSDSKTAKIFLNGQLLFESDITDCGVMDNQSSVTIGALSEFPSNRSHFGGCIDDVRIYNYVLSDQEIQQIYNQQ